MSPEPGLRLLIVSEFNNPDWVSVPLVGHNHAAALARHHEVTLVTRAINQEAIERRRPGYRELVCLSFPWLDRLFEWILAHVFKGDHGSQALTIVRVPFYLAFEWRLWRLLKARLAAGEFDAVLRLTPVSPVMPSLLAGRLRRLGVPFVVGPVNGGLPWPEGYEQAERQREWVSRLRSLYRVLPYISSTYRDASAILAGSSQTWKELAQYQDRMFLLPENGIHPEALQERAERPAGDTLRLIFVGRLVPYKACDLALRAAASLLREGRARFTVVGGGPERERLDQLVSELGVGAAVNFTGDVPHATVLEAFRRADVLVFPSVREFGGGVVFEALAAGCVPVVSDYGGPGDVVTEAVGFKVPLLGEASSCQEFARVLEELAADPHRLTTLSRAGQDYAREHLSWSGKAQRTTQVLNWVTGRGPKPEMRPPARGARKG